MPIKRLCVSAGLVSLLLVSVPGHAETSTLANFPVIANGPSRLMSQLPVFNPAPLQRHAGVAVNASSWLAARQGSLGSVDIAGRAVETAPTISTARKAADNATDLRKALIALAMKLRHIRYVRGGHDPATGFDCSGFVRYVFAHAVGMQLPTNSIGQFRASLKVKRADMKPGDLVFFHTEGRRRISHVGIYIADGRFIHSPTTGKSVEISSLHNAYWARHFAGAKRPDAMALVASNG
ncbi:MAG: peptidoglycan endopeptidase [Rhodanobacter sp.]|nr:MAG: peptidoglycan endopeptidase [Rhodanobacter sp.]